MPGDSFFDVFSETRKRHETMLFTCFREGREVPEWAPNRCVKRRLHATGRKRRARTACSPKRVFVAAPGIPWGGPGGAKIGFFFQDPSKMGGPKTELNFGSVFGGPSAGDAYPGKEGF